MASVIQTLNISQGIIEDIIKGLGIGQNIIEAIIEDTAIPRGIIEGTGITQGIIEDTAIISLCGLGDTNVNSSEIVYWLPGGWKAGLQCLLTET